MTNYKLNIADALASLHPEGWVVRGGVYSGLEWNDNVPEKDRPTEAEIDAELIRLQAEYDEQEYARKRAEAYPSVGDQLDMIYKDMKNSTTTHAEAVEAIKTKFPKE